MRPRRIGCLVNRLPFRRWKVQRIAAGYHHERFVVPQSQPAEGHFTWLRVKFHRRAACLEVHLQGGMEVYLGVVLLRIAGLRGVPTRMVPRIAPVPKVLFRQVEAHVHEQRWKAAGDVLQYLHSHRSVRVGFGRAHRRFLRPVPVVGIVHDHLGNVTKAQVFGQFALTFEPAEIKPLFFVHAFHRAIEAYLGFERFRGQHFSIVEDAFAQHLGQPFEALFDLCVVHLFHGVNEPELIYLPSGGTEGFHRRHEVEEAGFHPHGMATVYPEYLVFHRGQRLACPYPVEHGLARFGVIHFANNPVSPDACLPQCSVGREQAYVSGELTVVVGKAEHRDIPSNAVEQRPDKKREIPHIVTQDELFDVCPPQLLANLLSAANAGYNLRANDNLRGRPIYVLHSLPNDLRPFAHYGHIDCRIHPPHVLAFVIQHHNPDWCAPHAHLLPANAGNWRMSCFWGSRS